MSAMGVDGIGSGGRPISDMPDMPDVPDAPGAAAGELDATRGAQAESAAGAEGALGAERATGSALLEQLRRGDIDLDGYLDAQVTAATAHVQGSLSASQADFIREALREQIAADPVLIELVRRATGAAPKTRA
jgi:hypothetical protein